MRRSLKVYLTRWFVFWLETDFPLKYEVKSRIKKVGDIDVYMDSLTDEQIQKLFWKMESYQIDKKVFK